MKNLSKLIAAVDLGSNSFRLIVGRVEEGPSGSQIYSLDQLKDPVRLASGLNDKKILDGAAIARATFALERFAERIRSFAPHQVRAVATNTFRAAKNTREFLPTLEAALGFPIEVIGGREEARLIYLGVAHDLPSNQGDRLVVDIGGGSTEFTIGAQYEPRVMESLFMGCVGYSTRFFAKGEITLDNLSQAVLMARKEIQSIAHLYRSTGWKLAVGSSGTAKALLDLIEAYGLGGHEITAEALRALGEIMLRIGHVKDIKPHGIKTDRLPVLPGGYAIMVAVFEELGITQMQVSESGLRQGVLYDLLGRTQQHDMRQVTVDQFMRRYAVDATHARHVSQLARALYQQLALEHVEPEQQEYALQQLQWVAALHEIGLSISHDGYHKHSAYILQNADMPGFSRQDQTILANFTLAHAGKLSKLPRLFTARQDWELVLVLRLAVLFYRRRVQDQLPPLHLHKTSDGYALSISAEWLAHHPLTAFGLTQEISEWAKIELSLKLVALD